MAVIMVGSTKAVSRFHKNNGLVMDPWELTMERERGPDVDVLHCVSVEAGSRQGGYH
jgi:hypothetical protein